jgi:hypothetical protein
MAGNGHADHFAKRGSSLAEELSSTTSDCELFKQSRAWYGWLATVIANWPNDTQRRETAARRKRAKVRSREVASERVRSRSRGSRRAESSAIGAFHAISPAGSRRTESSASGSVASVVGDEVAYSHGSRRTDSSVIGSPHAIEAAGSRRTESSAIGSSSGGVGDGDGTRSDSRRANSSVTVGRRDACSGGSLIASGSRRTDSSTTGLGAGHDLYRSGGIIWCRLCGYYGEKRLKNLKLPCAGLDKSARAGQLGRLVKGEHPLRKGERLPRPVRFTGT